MRVVMFYHSVLSDWNHGDAHFLRGIAGALQYRGHDVVIYEDRNAWSVRNLVADQGPSALTCVYDVYPQLRIVRYDRSALDLNEALAGAHMVVVHEWNDPELVFRVAAHRRQHDSYRLLFHDTHHRCIADSEGLPFAALQHFDAVLVSGESIREIYVRRQDLAKDGAENLHVWHEAADDNVFYPRRRDLFAAPLNGRNAAALRTTYEGDLVWIGNWGDDERVAEIHDFLIEPVRRLKLKARVYGVRYPSEAIRALSAAGIEYAGWLPNFRVPETFAEFRVTLHIPRRPYANSLLGIPTIRPFEAMACGIPLICVPWSDTEQLFTLGKDYLLAHDTDEMANHLELLLNCPEQARCLAVHAYRTILQRHTCAHRAEELLALHKTLLFQKAGVPS